MSRKPQPDPGVQRLQQLTTLLKQGVPELSARALAEGEMQLRSKLAAPPIPRLPPHRMLQRLPVSERLGWAGIALALVAAFVLGRYSYKPTQPRASAPFAPTPQSQKAEYTSIRTESQTSFGQEDSLVPIQGERPVSQDEPKTQRRSKPAKRRSEVQSPPPPRKVFTVMRSPQAKVEEDGPDSEGPLSRQEANIGLGFRFLRQGNFVEAARSFEQISLQGPHDIRPDAAYMAGVCWGRAEQRQLAKAAYQRLIELDQSHAKVEEASVALGWLLLSEKRWAEAKAAFERGLSASTTQVQAGARKGLAQLPSAL